MPPSPAIISTISPLVFEEQPYVLHSQQCIAQHGCCSRLSGGLDNLLGVWLDKKKLQLL